MSDYRFNLQREMFTCKLAEAVVVLKSVTGAG
eukprot:SAG31_NODE_45635_length_258_cov_0.647799_1_plen_31_part_10